MSLLVQLGTGYGVIPTFESIMPERSAVDVRESNPVPSLVGVGHPVLYTIQPQLGACLGGDHLRETQVSHFFNLNLEELLLSDVSGCFPFFGLQRQACEKRMSGLS